MSTIVLTVDDQRSWVRSDVDFSDVLADAVSIARTRPDTGAVAFVRSAGPTGSVTATYQQLNSNGDFETNITDWTALNGVTLAQSAVQAHRGTKSMSMTTAATAAPGAESGKYAAIPGQSYAVTAWINAPGLVSPSVGINWYNASNTLISSTLPVAVAAVTAGWNLKQQFGTITVIAPPGTATASVVVQYATGLSPGTGIVFYLDEVRLLSLASTSSVILTSAVSGFATVYDTEMPLDVLLSYAATGYLINGTLGVQAGSATAGPVQVRTNGYGWLKDPLAPAGNQAVTTGRRVYSGVLRGAASGGQRGIGFLGLRSISRKAFSSLLDVNNQARPVPTSRKRGSEQATLGLVAHSFADRDALQTLLSPGNPLLFQMPAQYGVTDRYLEFGDEAHDVLGQDQRMQARPFSLPHQVVDAPAGPGQGVLGARYQDLCNQFASWGLLTASNGGALDLFGRTVGAGSWGSADVGGAYTNPGGGTVTYSVTPGLGLMSIPSTSNRGRSVLSVSVQNTEATVAVKVPVVATGSYIEASIMLRFVDTNNYYALGLRFGLAGAVTAFILKRVATVETDINAVVIAGLTYVANSVLRIDALISGTSLQVKGWLDGTREPTLYQAIGTDSAFAAAGGVGLTSVLNGGNTNAPPVVMSFSNFRVAGPLTWTKLMDGAAG